METLGWILVLTTIGGLAGVASAGGLLLVPDARRARLMPAMVAFAIGAFLGAVFLGVLPESLETAGDGAIHAVLAWTLGGVVAFFVMEKLLRWHHCHHAECDVHERAGARASAAMVLAGDAAHNLVDGVLIAAACVADVRLGVTATLAVVAHEVPQEIADFAVLLRGGYGRGKAFIANAASNLTTIGGGVAAWAGLRGLAGALPYVLAVAAGGFLYIAMADLIPDLHHRVGWRPTVAQLLWLALGVGAITAGHWAVHHVAQGGHP